MNENSLWGHLIIEELCRLGIRDFCIAPGSRSTPLVAAVAQHPHARGHVFFDERCAAFFALGMAKYYHHPTVLITTSGTAISHAFPALLEAEAQNIPLLLLSADRPPELRNSGANQTIDQNKLFGDHVRFFFDLPCPSADMKPAQLLSLLDHAAAHAKEGPVHINCMFRKPLDPIPVSMPKIWKDDGPFSTIHIEQRTTSWTTPNHQRAVLVIGSLSSPNDQQQALQIAQSAHCPVFCDAASGLRCSPIPSSLYPIDSILRFDTESPFLLPDLIVILGGNFVSKELSPWLNKQHSTIVQIQPTKERKTGLPATKIVASIPPSIGKLHHPLPANRIQREIDSRIQTTLQQQDGFLEPSIIRTCIENLRPSVSIFLSNSMPIRDFNRFSPQPNHHFRSAVNRGASGIDGIVSTAAGWTYASQNPAILIIGDVACLHDIGSFLQLSPKKIPLLVCVINNGGGGIFSFLPIAKEEHIFEEYFATEHQIAITPITQAMGVPTTTIYNNKEWTDCLQHFLHKPQFSVVEVQTDRKENVLIHREIEQSIQSYLAQNWSDPQ